MSAGRGEGRAARLFTKTSCLSYVAVCVIGNLAMVFGAGAYVQYTFEHATSWTDLFSPSFAWQYARSPVGAPISIVFASTTVLALAFCARWWVRTRGDGGGSDREDAKTRE